MEQSENVKYWEHFFQSLQMTYYSLLAAPLFIFAIAFLRAENGNETILKLTSEYTYYLVLFLSLGTLLGVLILFLMTRRRYNTIAAMEELTTKMKAYKQTTLTKYITLSLLQVLIVFAYAATYHNALLGVFTALLLYASFFRPELQTARRALKLDKETFRKINYKTNIIN